MLEGEYEQKLFQFYEKVSFKTISDLRSKFYIPDKDIVVKAKNVVYKNKEIELDIVK